MGASEPLDRSELAVPARRRFRRAAIAFVAAPILFVTLPASEHTAGSGARAAEAGRSSPAGVAAVAPIQSGGPLTTIAISPDLGCAVNHAADAHGEWYGDWACATLVSAGGFLYGPATIPAGSGATEVPGYTAFTPKSQTGPTGSGSLADPLTVTTVVDLGGSGLQLTQVDSYVVGQESYRTDVTLTTSSAQITPVIVYRGGDCYLQDSDVGLGDVHNGTAPICRALPTSTDPDRIEGFYPLSPDSRYLEAFFDDVWRAIGAQQPLPNACRCSEEIDNGVALSWSGIVLPGSSWTTSSLTLFSPLGGAAISFAKSADVSGVGPGAVDGYTVSVANPGVIPQTLTQIVDTLPPGFTYTPGTTTGATTRDPVVRGSTLTWAETFFIPAASGGVPGTVRLHFGVTASSTAGTYTNTVTGSGAGVSVVAATEVAPITVILPGVNLPPNGSAGGPYSGTVATPISIAGAASDPDQDPLATTWTIGPGAPAGCAFADPANLATTVTCDTAGLYALTLTISDGRNPPVVASTTIAVTSGATTTVPAPTTTVAAGRLTIDPAAIDFGSGPIGTTLPQAMLTVTNAGGSPVQISGVVLDGAGAAEFAVAADGCGGKTLSPAGTCTVAVLSIPQRGGASAATLTVTGRGTSATATLQVVGTYTPTLRVSPGVLRTRDTGTATGAGFPPNTEIQLAYAGQAPFVVVTSDASGGLLTQIDIRPGDARIGGQVLTAVDRPGLFTDVRTTFVVQIPTMRPVGPASPAIVDGVRALRSRSR